MSERSDPSTPPSPLKRALRAVEDMQARLDAAERARREPIAVIGMGCRFPGGANDPEAFWQLLRDGVDAIQEVPADRWNNDDFYDPDPDTPGKTHARSAGFIDQPPFDFDAQFFGISPREGASIDPQQRLLLEVSWEALESACVAPETLAGTSTGVYVGIWSIDFWTRLLSQPLAEHDAYIGTGSTHSVAAGRLSYVLGLEGPCMVVDTACSSSLVTVHLACQSLRTGESDMALAGGVNMMLTPESSVDLSMAGMLAADGRCKTFDASADGFGRAEGCGMLVLKRLSDAQADGDRVLALIRGSAVNQDGRTSGLTVPNGPAQQAVIRTALDSGGLDAADVTYVEAHGTGTSLGDPIEIRAITGVFGAGRTHDDPIIVGSVKTNVGHLESAAGVAGLAKLIVSLPHGQIPPHLHLENPNPHIPWDELPVRVPTTLMPWPPGASGRRVAGISSFGASGTNAHVIVEEAPDPVAATSTVERPRHLLALSAKSEAALRALADRYDHRLAETTGDDLADVCHSAATGRSHFKHRLAIAADSVDEIRAALSTVARGGETAAARRDRCDHAPDIAVLFTGQGSQYAGMGAQLYETQPTFRRSLDECHEILRPLLDTPLLDVIHPKAAADASRLDDTAFTQPALFAIEYALAALWESWGIQPSAVMGHSVGEYVAACVAGVFTLEDGLRLIAERARLMQALPRDGSMAAVFGSETQVLEAIASFGRDVSIAAINGPENTVVSGRTEAVEAALATLADRGIESTMLKVSHAFHSSLMDPMLASFERVARSVTYAEPHTTLVSNVTGKPATEQIAMPEYWVSHVRQPVRFADGMETLREIGCNAFVEVGPKPVLLGMGAGCIPPETGAWLPSLRPDQADWTQLLDSVAQLYVRGAAVDWRGFDGDYVRRKVALPTYPFQRRRHCVPGFTTHPGAASGNGAPGSVLDVFLEQFVDQFERRLGMVERMSEQEVQSELRG